MAWFPNNNHPRDKATYDFHITVPATLQHALGNGELVGVAPVDNARRHDDLELALTATRWRRYLTTVDGRPLRLHAVRRRHGHGRERHAAELYNVIETALAGEHEERPTTRPPRARTRSSSSSRTTIGAPYPFDSHRRRRRTAPPARLRARGPDQVALRRRARSASARSRTRSRTSGSATASAQPVARHLVQRGLGDLVGAVDWSNKQNGATLTTAQSFLNNYNTTRTDDWSVAAGQPGRPRPTCSTRSRSTPARR